MNSIIRLTICFRLVMIFHFVNQMDRWRSKEVESFDQRQYLDIINSPALRNVGNFQSVTIVPVKTNKLIKSYCR